MEIYDLHPFESNGESLEFIDSLLADNKYLFPVAACGEGGVRGPNPTQGVSKAANDVQHPLYFLAEGSPGVSNTNLIMWRTTTVSMLLNFINP